MIYGYEYVMIYYDMIWSECFTITVIFMVLGFVGGGGRSKMELTFDMGDSFAQLIISTDLQCYNQFGIDMMT